MRRRGFLKTLLGIGASARFAPLRAASTAYAEGGLRLPEGYEAQVLLRWGDPLLPGAPPFDPRRQSAAAQAMQFGYNCDYVAFMPLPADSANSNHGLLVVNHEYALPRTMFPTDMKLDARERRRIEIAAVGMSVVQIRRNGSRWHPVIGNRFNRRITPDTPARLTGPAAGHARLRNSFSPDGRETAIGTFSNCAGGVTPWGTVLSGEENPQLNFVGNPDATTEAASHRRYGVRGSAVALSDWGRFDARFDLDRTPNGPLHGGWMVEINPHDPEDVPRKLTALGRFAHEGAGPVVNGDGRVVVYLGDDAPREFLYRYVSRERVRNGDLAHNRRLLEDGELSVASLHDDGRLAWLPLVHGRGPLTPANGFASQGDVLLDTRRAADVLGATPTDRPEEIEVNPATNTVFAMLTGGKAATHPAGKILELIPPDGDHAAAAFRWETLLLGGNPAVPAHGARFHPATGPNDWFAAPDNCTFDVKGRLWVASDGMRAFGAEDGLFVVEVRDPNRARSRRLLAVPTGTEPTGPCFTPDGATLFLAIQVPDRGHPYDQPATRWPDFDPALPPRPSVVAIRRHDGGVIGDV